MSIIPFYRISPYIALSFFLFIILQSCIYRIDEVKVVGEFQGNSRLYIYISKLEGDSLALIDSIRTSSRGNFKIKLKVENPYFVTIGLAKIQPSIILLIQPGEDISIQSDKSNLSDYKVFGSDGSALIRSLTLTMKKTKHQIDSLKNVYNTNIGSIQIDSIKHMIDSTYNNLVANHRGFSYNLINDNTFSLVSVLALFQSYDSLHPVFDYVKDRKLFRLVDSTLLSVYPSNSMVKSYHAKIYRLDSLYELSLKRDLMYRVGEVLPNVGYPLITGDSLFIRDIWFRYILVDFQGSWCEFCKKNNSQLKKIYKEYAPKGLVVLQVSLGISPDSLRTKVLRDSLMWYNACLPDIYNSRLLDTLKVSSVPASYIIDRWGVIRATNLSGEKLRLKLSELLPK